MTHEDDKTDTNRFKAPRLWLPNRSIWILCFSTASHMASFGFPTSVIVSATTTCDMVTIFGQLDPFKILNLGLIWLWSSNIRVKCVISYTTPAKVTKKCGFFWGNAMVTTKLYPKCTQNEVAGCGMKGLNGPHTQPIQMWHLIGCAFGVQLGCTFSISLSNCRDGVKSIIQIMCWLVSVGESSITTYIIRSPIFNTIHN